MVLCGTRYIYLSSHLLASQNLTVYQLQNGLFFLTSVNPFTIDSLCMFFLVTERSECEWVSLCMCPMFMYAKKFVCCVLCLYEEWESSVAPLCSRPHENIHFSIRCGNCVDVCLFLCTHKMMLSKRCECGREMLTKKMNYCLGEIVR